MKMFKELFLILTLFVFSSCANLQENNSFSAPIVKGKDASKIDSNGIRQTFISHQQELQACYRDALKNNKDLKGKMTFDFTFGEAGKVLNAQVDPTRTTFTSDELGGCIQKLILSWTFPAPPAGTKEVQVFYPMAFSDK
ncbi:AgmX/PglI C-terminal domain-containing protein [bacterium]|nr:AgmX/PglI C-terminal domain-containing protein [bacterium]